MRLIKKLFKYIIIFIVLCAVAEAVLRFMKFEFQPVPVIAEKYFPKNAFQKIEYEFNQDLFEKDPQLLWRFRVGQVLNFKSVNPKGMLYDFEREPYEEAKVKVLCVGDGCTAGLPNGYPDYLDIYLRQMGIDRDIAVYNAGVYGYSSYQCRKYLERLLPEINPDIVVTYFMWNDMRPGKEKTDQQLGGGNPVLLKIYNLLSPTRVFQGCRKLFEDGKEKLGLFGRSTGDSPLRVPESEFRDNLDGIKNLLAESGKKIVWIIPWHSIDPDGTSILDFEDLGSPKNTISKYENYRHYFDPGTGSRNSNELTVNCEKLFTQYPKKVYFQEGGIFPSPLAHNVIAEQLLTMLVELGHIPKYTYDVMQGKRTYDSQHPHRLEAKIEVKPRVVVATVMQPVSVEVIYRNTGDTVWLDDSDFGYVELGCRLRDSKGNLLEDTYFSFPIPRIMKPGDKASTVINVPVPGVHGEYLLEFDMKNVGICWFSDTGSPTVTVNLRVI